jgi:hypothetical protein
MKKIVLFALLCASQLSLAKDRIGNGNGDGVFALQKLEQKNPSLTPSEILLKAFHESQGRPVDLSFWKGLKFDINKDKNDSVRSFNFYGLFLFNIDESTQFFLKYSMFGNSLQNISVDEGPLLGTKEELAIYLQGNHNIQIVNSNNRTLLMEEKFKTKAWTAEVRAYSENIILGVSFVFQELSPRMESKRLICKLAGVSAPLEGDLLGKYKVGDICGIFYLWR